MFLRETIYFFLNVWQASNFFYIIMLPLTLFFIYNLKYSFSSGKTWLRKILSFLERCVHSKNKQLLLPIFPWKLFFD